MAHKITVVTAGSADALQVFPVAAPVALQGHAVTQYEITTKLADIAKQREQLLADINFKLGENAVAGGGAEGDT